MEFRRDDGSSIRLTSLPESEITYQCFLAGNRSPEASPARGLLGQGQVGSLIIILLTQ